MIIFFILLLFNSFFCMELKNNNKNNNKEIKKKRFEEFLKKIGSLKDIYKIKTIYNLIGIKLNKEDFSDKLFELLVEIQMVMKMYFH